MTDGGKVDGGTLDVRPDAPAEREAMSMPDGTHGFLVTLEKPQQADPESLTVRLVTTFDTRPEDVAAFLATAKALAQDADA